MFLANYLVITVIKTWSNSVCLCHHVRIINFYRDSIMIRIGIIGCGYWGINYVRVFSELPDVTVSRVCDTSDERLLKMHRKFPNVFPTKLMDELLADDEIDAVVVATEASTHYDITRACLLNNKHVLIEKPMTTSVEEGEDLVRLAEEKNLKLMVGHTFLYNPAIRKMKEYLTDDDIGSIYYLKATRTHLGLIRKDHPFLDEIKHYLLRSHFARSGIGGLWDIDVRYGVSNKEWGLVVCLRNHNQNVSL
jgi:predicted dehydrogenase